MSAESIEPQPIAPGWLKRWMLASIDLYSRSWTATLLIIGTSLLAEGCLPANFGLNIFCMLPAFALAFILLRIVDQHSTTNILAYVRNFWHDSRRDIIHLTQDIFLFILADSLFSILTSFLTHPSHSLASLKHPSFVTVSQVLTTHLGANQWLLYFFINLHNATNSLLWTPLLPPLLYLTLYLGHAFLLNFQKSWLAALSNGTIFFFFFIFTFLLPHFLIEMTVIGGTKIFGFPIAFLFWMLVTSCLNLIFLSFGYLWSRELFEGKSKNSPAIAKASSSILATSSNIA